jgi:signal transduction histidine kinase
MLDAPGNYGKTHARFHPTLHRYQTAFGLYDIFLIDGDTGRVLYSVFKEIDLGASLQSGAARDSALGKAYREAMLLPETEQFVLRDYEGYIPSHGQPASFAAAPIWRAAEKRGVLAMQVSIREVNRVMTADGNWEAEGLGKTGHTYVVGSDGLLRSDLRKSLESSVLSTGVLREKAPLSEGALRSEGKIAAPGLDWTVRAEIERTEAFAPVEKLRVRLLNWGIVLGFVFLTAGAVIGRSVTRPLQGLAEGARRLGRRDFSFRFPVKRTDELGELEAAFNEMVVELERTTASKSDLERLAGRLITSQEDERKRVARELHDDLSQRLAALAIEAGRLEHLAGGVSEELRAGFERVKKQVAALSDDVHGISRGLHPALLEDLGLETAIEVEARSFFERGGAPVEVEAGSMPPTLSADAKLALYRIVQEGLRNVQKDADAEKVHIVLCQDGNAVVLRLRDDGRGFDRTAKGFRPGLGLASMEERVRLLGGSLRVESSPGKGTLIEVRIPANC